MTVKEAEAMAQQMYESWLRAHPKSVSRLSQEARDSLKMYVGYLIWREADKAKGVQP